MQGTSIEHEGACHLSTLRLRQGLEKCIRYRKNRISDIPKQSVLYQLGLRSGFRILFLVPLFLRAL